jgi:DNA repair protein RecN (Recombination protein N)
MLGLKAVIAEKDQPGTLIFDEIDIGISGRVARKVGLKLLQTSKSQQLLVITHLPQIASLPARHFSAVKVEQSGRAFSRFILLEGKERINEIAKLLTTGEAEGKGEDYAKELLEAEDVLQV